MKTKQLLMLLIVVTVSVSVFAQEIPAGQTNLMQLKGKWVAKNASMNMGGKDYKGDFIAECVAINDNTGIRVNETFTNDELGTMLAEDLIGFDPNTNQVHMYTIDNMGTTHDHVGYWVDDHHMFLQYQGVMEGKMYLEQLDFVFKDANTMNFKMMGMLNGEVIQSAEMTFVK